MTRVTIKKTKSMHRLIQIGGGILVFIVVLLAYLHDRSVRASKNPSSTSITNRTTFRCDDNKVISAVFSPEQVTLKLSDGRAITLPHAAAADGARYVNKNESFVFWTTGNTAFIEENGATAYANCFASGS